MRAATLTAVTAQFHPTRDNVLIRRRASEKATTLGILIPDAVHKPLNRGSVVAVGSGRRTSNGTLIPPAVAPGDEILLTPDSGIEITVAGEQLIVASEQDVLGVFTHQTATINPRRSRLMALNGSPGGSANYQQTRERRRSRRTSRPTCWIASLRQLRTCTDCVLIDGLAPALDMDQGDHRDAAVKCL